MTELAHKVIDYFIEQESAWAILFVLSFIYMIFTNARRETERRNEVKDYREKLDSDIEVIQKNTALMLEIWKLIVERELQRRDK